MYTVPNQKWVKFMQTNLQFISSLTDVETGTEMLLFAAWQVRMVWRSVLFRSLRTSSFSTL